MQGRYCGIDLPPICWPYRMYNVLNKKEKSILKTKRKNIIFGDIKSAILSVVHSATLAFFFALLFSSFSDDSVFIDICMSLLFFIGVYIFMAIYLFGSLSLCLKLTCISFRIKIKK